MLDQSGKEFKSDWIPSGFQIKKIRRPRKNTPAWANKDSSLVARALSPRSVRRIRTAYLYWRCNWNAREIAEELKTTVKAVELMIYKMRHSK